MLGTGLCTRLLVQHTVALSLVLSISVRACTINAARGRSQTVDVDVVKGCPGSRARDVPSYGDNERCRKHSAVEHPPLYCLVSF